MNMPTSLQQVKHQANRPANFQAPKPWKSHSPESSPTPLQRRECACSSGNSSALVCHPRSLFPIMAPNFRLRFCIGKSSGNLPTSTHNLQGRSEHYRTDSGTGASIRSRKSRGNSFFMPLTAFWCGVDSRQWGMSTVIASLHSLRLRESFLSNAYARS